MSATETLHTDHLARAREFAEGCTPEEPSWSDPNEVKAAKIVGRALGAGLLYIGDALRALAERGGGQP